MAAIAGNILAGIKNPNFLEDLQMIIPRQFGFNCPSGLREEAF
jgi:methionine synthase I (cobalamin-dependent)